MPLQVLHVCSITPTRFGAVTVLGWCSHWHPRTNLTYRRLYHGVSRLAVTLQLTWGLAVTLARHCKALA